MSADVRIQNEGSIYLLHPETDAANEWIDEKVQAGAQRFGLALVVEHRYVVDIIEGMQADGLTLKVWI